MDRSMLARMDFKETRKFSPSNPKYLRIRDMQLLPENLL